MNKFRGLSTRSVLNTNISLCKKRKGIYKNETNERSLKDITETKFYKNVLNSNIDTNDKVLEPTDGENDDTTTKIVSTVGIVENKFTSVELTELNVINNIDFPKTNIEYSQENDEPQTGESFDEIPYLEDDQIEESSDNDNNVYENSVVRDDDDDENEFKQENYDIFIEKYNNLINNIDFDDTFMKKYQDIFNDKLRDIKNQYKIHNYSVEQMLNIIKTTLIEFTDYEIQKIIKSMENIERKKDYKNLSKTQILLKSSTYKKYNEKLLSLQKNKQVIIL